MNKTILTVAFSLSFVINSILITNAYTRRSAQEIQLIHTAEAPNLDEVKRKAEECVKLGGLPHYYDNGNWNYCEK